MECNVSSLTLEAHGFQKRDKTVHYLCQYCISNCFSILIFYEDKFLFAVQTNGNILNVYLMQILQIF